MNTLGQNVSPTKVGITIHVLSISKVDDFNQVCFTLLWLEHGVDDTKKF